MTKRQSRKERTAGAAVDTAAPAARAPYAVGYGRPPKHTQFKPGLSGNPKGRPRGAKNATTLLHEALHRPVTITENGRRKRVPVIDVFFRRVVKGALEGDRWSGNQLLRLLLLSRSETQSGAEGAEAGAEEGAQASDRAVLRAFLAMLKEDGLTEADLDLGEFDDAPVR